MPERTVGGLTRRDFVVATAGALGMRVLPEPAPAATGTDVFPESPLVLFQGDSITDAGRNRALLQPNQAAALGTGYPLLIASAVLRERPDRQFRFLNRGISGDKVPDLEARWQTDTVGLRPAILSVLVGVNDFWHTLTHGYTGTVSDYEAGYAALLDGTRAALPEVTLAVLEPFALRTGAVDGRWYPEFDARRSAAARVAKRTGAVFVPLQDRFDQLASRVGPEYWAADGVHPTPAGHAAIAERWRQAVGI